MSDTRRFDSLEKTVSDTARSLDEKTSTLFQRVADHKHDAADVASGTLSIARVPTGRTSTTVPLGDHSHNRDVPGEVRTRFVSDSIILASSTSFVNTTLGFTVGANGDFLLEAFMFYTSPTAADFRMALTFPSGTVGSWSLLGRTPASTTAGADTSTWDAGELSDQLTVGGLSNKQFASVTVAFSTSSSAGSLNLFFAKAATATGNAAIYQNSSSRLTRI